MRAIETPLPGVLLMEPKMFGDSRGFFYESWNVRTFREVRGVETEFKQDNCSRSERHVLRGLHYQLQRPQGKLVWVVRGSVFDVVVDLRRSSPTFGRWFGAELSEDNHRQLWVPPGLAHGFVVRSEFADFLYKATDFYAPEYERCIRWDDPQIGIDWGLEGMPLLSAKDQQGLAFAEAETYP
ncbi:MAG: dTDP-4-dehydrorhamnose 3,5-epimerase [Caedimonas sp.]|jgi:dTDP-4-dehydrorhamnose 3,5-epimerase|nr:dTDP-4-dehydrorhamnose 3,5-epimerase [Caedimonas sp.]